MFIYSDSHFEDCSDTSDHNICLLLPILLLFNISCDSLRDLLLRKAWNMHEHYRIALVIVNFFYFWLVALYPFSFHIWALNSVESAVVIWKAVPTLIGLFWKEIVGLVSIFLFWRQWYWPIPRLCPALLSHTAQLLTCPTCMPQQSLRLWHAFLEGVTTCFWIYVLQEALHNE